MIGLPRRTFVAGSAGENAKQHAAAEAPKGKRRTTPLNDLHAELGGRMVDFAGWNLPVQYQGEGIMTSHLHTRSKASLFDVSHMGQLRLHGADRVNFLERLVVGDIKSLAPTEARLSLLTNKTGGIIDDCIVTAQKTYLSMVVNAGCREKDVSHITTHLEAAKEEGLDVALEQMDHLALLALQGPEAMHALQALLPKKVDLRTIPFMSSVQAPIGDIGGCTISRCGYTGEDGFEISVPAEKAVELARHFLSSNDVDIKMAGLGARDTLRLEAGLCLYGHDISEEFTPVEAGLTWTVGKRRRAEGGFLGWETIMSQIKGGVSRKLVGMLLSNKAPAREGARILGLASPNDQVGRVTSGTFSPSLLRPIAMGYVSTSHAKPGTKLLIELRGKMVEADVTKMPFVSASYYRLP